MIKKFIIVIILLLTATFSNAENVTANQTPTNESYLNQYYGLDYDNYVGDPSQAIYDSTQDMYIYENYGSSESMDYLNRGDAGSYSGGSDFDRNY